MLYGYHQVLRILGKYALHFLAFRIEEEKIGLGIELVNQYLAWCLDNSSNSSNQMFTMYLNMLSPTSLSLDLSITKKRRTVLICQRYT